MNSRVAIFVLALVSAGFSEEAKTSPRPESESRVGSDALLENAADERSRPFIKTLLYPRRLARQAKWLGQLEELPADHFSHVIAAFKVLNGAGLANGYQWEFQAFWERWAEVSPATAMEGLKRWEQEVQTNQAVLEAVIIRQWAEQDAKSARLHLENNNLHGNAQLLRSFVEGWATRDLKAATAFVVENWTPQDQAVAHAMAVLPEAAVRQGQVAGLLEWYHNLPAPDEENSMKAAAMSGVAAKLGGDNIKQVAEFVATETTPRIYNASLIISIATRYANAFGEEAAMGWVGTLPPYPKNNSYNGAGVIAERWVQKDPPSFTKWLLANRENKIADSAIFGLVRYLARTKSSEAQKWATEIKNERLREEALGFIR